MEVTGSLTPYFCPEDKKKSEEKSGKREAPEHKVTAESANTETQAAKATAKLDDTNTCGAKSSQPNLTILENMGSTHLKLCTK